MANTIRTKPRAHRPITQHPLFPAVVALWFGALFGMAAAAIRAATLEAVVRTLRIDSVIVAAAPPLGPNAQVAFALLLTAIGGVIGYIAARRLAGDPAPVSVRQPTPTASEWPGTALSQAGAEPFEPVAEIEARAPIDEEHEDGPAASLDIAETPIEDPAIEEIANAPSAAKPLSAAERLASADLDALSHVELMERLAIAIDRRRQRINQADTGIGTGADTGIALPGLRNDPVVSFPAAAARRTASVVARNDHTEAALRDALATLQRMSRG